MSPIERLKFAVAFVQENLKALRPGDVLNRKNDLKEFCAYNSSTDDFICLVPKSDPEQMCNDDLYALQQRWRIILHAIANRDKTRRTWPPKAPWWDSIPSLTKDNATVLEIALLPVSNKEKSVLMIVGSVQDTATYQLLNCLALLGHNAILPCADPNCPMFFVRLRRQRFCSRRCAVNNAVTNHRAKVGKVKGNYSRKAEKGEEKTIQQKRPHKRQTPRQ